ncbi:MAG: cell wall hydrolase [Phenylobacterium sp.]|nr:cell wall hydrolase [Phenylobacterium sp.]MCA6289693.1 cell wall hydrolase [Phenylobacterium sp.]MCA6310950.1 cell wall hydrolase [Phenylobacterium sp.]MCA6324493.1 cell wall hydrolase [Phenylobacterium sp.]MCA6338222.1 cell wall hydrolase [Phenylobacterium sp.]
MSSSRNEATLIGSSSTGSDPIADSAFGAISSETEKTAAGMKRSPAQTFARELNCLTQAVYFEARGESPAGQAAVAQVVLNRVRKAGFPKSVCGVVFQGSARGAGCQFSFACDGSMRQAREARSWSQARHIAARALAGAVMTAVGDATHFHTVHVSPDWSRDLREVTQVGLHIFYRIGRTSDGEILADAPGDPILADVRGADARLVSGPAGDPIEVVEAPPPPSPPAVVSTADPGEAHAPAA